VTRSLVVIDQPPYPPLGGQQLRYRQAIEALAALGPVTLLSLWTGEDAAPAAAGLSMVRVDPRTPRTRAYRWARYLGPRGKKTARAILTRWWLQTLRARVAALIDEAAPDVIVIENPELMNFLPPLAQPGRAIVYDAHNVEKVLWPDLVALRKGLGDKPPPARFRERILVGEAALVASADQVWVCSDADARLLGKVYPTARPTVHVVPNTVDTVAFDAIAQQRLAAGIPPRAPTLLFTGNFAYAPNVEAGLALILDLLPRIRASRPDVRLVLCGRQPPPGLAAAAARAGGTIVTGEVPDVRPWFAEAELFVVPLRHGGGTRLKILEAMAAGCPVVSTYKGAEGLDLQHGQHLRLADGMEAIAATVLECLQNQQAAIDMAMRGRERVIQLYSWQANNTRVRAAVTALDRRRRVDAAEQPVGMTA
jgi:glycosyltransferase involved in cell wall biosynthesis